MNKIGVLLTNLGTPVAPTTKAVRVYLREFLSDRRVIALPPVLWQPLLNLFILTTRPRLKAKAYQKIWTQQGSPLLFHTQSLQPPLEMLLNEKKSGITVKIAMRYGNPSLQQAFNEFRAQNIYKICVLPLYPQYSSATTASTFDQISKILKTWKHIPDLRFIHNYFTFQPYIDAIANSIKSFWQNHTKGEKLIFSFHGLPKILIRQGDPYETQCKITAKLLADTLGLSKHQWQISFQSRFGKVPWLQPYTDQTLKNLAKEGIKTVDVVCPGFAADCLETLEEIEQENQRYFLKAGGIQFHYIPALNASDMHIKTLCQLIDKHIKNWD